MVKRLLFSVCSFGFFAGILTILLYVPLASSASSLPPGFTDTLVTDVAAPTALAFTADGRLLIASQTGILYVYQSNTLLNTPALNLTNKICSNIERGLLGTAVDPDFTINHYIYLYYTFNQSGACERNTAKSPVNRVSRFTLPDTNIIDPASELVLIDNIPSPNGNHNAGDLQFGNDGYLYIGVGDGGCDYADGTHCAASNDASRDQFILLGKVLRIKADGTIPPTNPFLGAGSARCSTTGRTEPGKKCQETFAWGLRNPFRLAFDPNVADTRFFINDVGQNTWEEIDLGQAGADYGWNVREGPCARGSTTDCGPPPAGMTNPLAAYDHSGGCASITGGAFVPNGVWPASYNGAYVFSDYVCGKILTLMPTTNGNYTIREFASGLGPNSAVTIIFGPDAGSQSLYYTTYANGGQIRRISYTGSNNQPPRAAAIADPTSSSVPLTVRFDASGSSDPDGDALTYEWNFGDGSAQATGVIQRHTFVTPGTYTVTLVVRDSSGATDSVTLRVDAGNTPPTAVITSPTDALRFAVGQPILLQGRATDAQDGNLPDANLTWEVLLHHNTHTHPYLPPTSGNNITIQAPAPEDLDATATGYLEIRLTATDSQGATSVTTQNARPNLVNVTFGSQPPGITLALNGNTITTPRTVVSWESYALNVTAPAQVNLADQVWTFQAWSDANNQPTRPIITPATASTFVAVYQTDNLLSNPDFEEDANSDNQPDGWSSSNRFTRSTAIAPHRGAFVGAFNPTNNAPVTISQVENGIVGGTPYSFVGWVNIPSISDGAPVFTLDLQIRWRGAKNKLISTDTIKTYTAPTNGWDRAAARLVPPPGAISARVRMVVRTKNAPIYVDDFVFQAGVSALLPQDLLPIQRQEGSGVDSDDE